jgi:MFS family permease
VIGGPLRQVTSSFRAVAAAFGNPDLRRLQIAWAGMSFSVWSFAIAVGVYAFQIGGPTAVGLVGLVRLLPGALAAPFAGLVADRHSRRAVLVVSALASAVVLGGAALVAAMSAPAAVVFTLAGAVTVVSSAYLPAEGALLPFVARAPQELSAANVAHSAMDSTGFLVGSVLTGVLLATTTPEVVFAAASVVAVLTALVLMGVGRDERPAYVDDSELSGVLRQTAFGVRALLSHPGLRLVGALLTVLAFFEGAADVLVVVLALDLLGLAQGSVGYLNAGWGFGALVGGAALAMLLDRGKLASGLVLGSVATGVAMALAGAWAVPAAAYAAWIGIGIGFTVVEVTGRTLLQRLGSDEVLARVLGFMETSRLAAMALGAITAPVLVALLGARGAVVAVAGLLPLFAALRWESLRAYEIGAPVAERPYALLRENTIFAPLPVATLERLSRDLVPVEADRGGEIITQGDRGDRFYVIDSGEVEVFEDGVLCRTQRNGDAFGEIALLRNVPRSATVRATRMTRLLALDRDHFIGAVTGHLRSRQAAERVAGARLPPTDPPSGGTSKAIAITDRQPPEK